MGQLQLQDNNNNNNIAIQAADMDKIYRGSLKSFSAASGYGFIHCAELWEKYKRDVYVHKSEMIMNNNNMDQDQSSVSMPCDFSLSLNDRGQPQAKNVKWLK